MKNLKLNVMSRIIILTNLPEQGSVVEMVAKRNIRKKVDFTSDELDKLNFKTNDDKMTWDTDFDVEIEFADSEIDLLKNIVNRLSESGLITDQILDFAEFILNC
jgi:repressor of nif and glnA expression